MQRPGAAMATRVGALSAFRCSLKRRLERLVGPLISLCRLTLIP